MKHDCICVETCTIMVYWMKVEMQEETGKKGLKSLEETG